LVKKLFGIFLFLLEEFCISDQRCKEFVELFPEKRAYYITV